ncbi:MAG: hypothetical protein IJI05_03910 [Erysipelotrichaceae bacterium]|nr:hypothetical protein [Erysipelotrichaceae bacterium]
MELTHETARSQQITAEEKAAQSFSENTGSISDALFCSADHARVFAVCGLPYKAPIAGALLNDPELYGILNQPDEDLLLTAGNEIRLYAGDKEISLDQQQRDCISAICSNILSAPGRLNEDGSLCLDLKAPSVGTHYSVNLLMGNREEYPDPLQTTPKSVLDRFGCGSFRGSQEKQVLATHYELDPAKAGEQANRQFYLTENGKQIFYSMDVEHNVEKAWCIHHQNWTEITYVTKCGLAITRTIFLLPQKKDFPTSVEAQRISITNNTDRTRDLRLVVTGMFGITDPGTLTSDIIYANVVVESELCMLDGKPIAISPHHQPRKDNSLKRFATLITDGKPFTEFTSDVSGFLGNGTYEKPDGLLRLSNSHSNRGAAFFALAGCITLLPKETKHADEFVGISEADHDVREDFYRQLSNLYNYYSDPNNLPATLEEIKKAFNDYASFLQLKTGERDLDAYVSYNLPFQVLYQTYISRSFAWTQKSYRETGFREIQDIFASMYYLQANGKNSLIKGLLTSWIENVFEFGYAYHNFTTRGKEPGMCSDDQLWLVQAVSRYVRMTGDVAFLKQEFNMAGSTRKRPLVDTLKAIIIYSGRISVGKHGLPLLDTADWNDTLRLDQKVLNGPEKEELYYRQLRDKNQSFGAPLDSDLSESIMNAFLLVIAARETAYLAKLAKDAETETLAEDIEKEVTENIRKHCWINDYYARCLINDGREYTYLGSTGDGLSADPDIDGTYFLNSYSWALLSEVADEIQTASMLDIVEKYLKTDAGLKLCTVADYFRLGLETGTSYYFPGDRENGGVFKHAAMMATVASLQAARRVTDPSLAERLRDLAYFMIDKALPYRTLDDPFVLKGNPRFCTQYNNSITGENIGPILSGTASWLTLALYEACGLNMENGLIHFDPVVNRKELSYLINIDGTPVNVSIDGSVSFRVTSKTTCQLDGQDCSLTVQIPTDKKEHTIRIIL